jgi:hypothetical protein
MCFLFNKIGEEGGTGSAWKRGVEGGGTIYTHVSNCKNDRIKGEKKKNLEQTNQPEEALNSHFHSRGNDH